MDWRQAWRETDVRRQTSSPPHLTTWRQPWQLSGSPPPSLSWPSWMGQQNEPSSPWQSVHGAECALEMTFTVAHGWCRQQLSPPGTPDSGWVCNSTSSHKTGMFSLSPCLSECRPWTYLPRSMEVSFLQLLYHSPLVRSAPVWWPSPEGKTASVVNTYFTTLLVVFGFSFVTKNKFASGGSDWKGKDGNFFLKKKFHGTCRPCRKFIFIIYIWILTSTVMWTIVSRGLFTHSVCHVTYISGSKPSSNRSLVWCD